MKIRAGFVSNSSTSSFLMVGFEMDKDALKEFARSLDIDVNDDDDWIYIMREETGLYVKKYFSDCVLDCPLVGIRLASGYGWVEIDDISQRLSDAIEKMEEMRDALGVPEDEDLKTVLAAEWG